jgi:uroporphyrinogen decarboxylase
MRLDHEPSQRIIRVCHRLPVESTPIWLMRQAGRYMQEYRSLRQKYSMLELCRTPELAAEVTMQPISRFDLDAAIIFADILLPLPALGVNFHFAKGEGPVVERPLSESRDVDRLQVDEAEERLSFVYEAIGMVRERLDRRLALIGFAGAPFTVASYMIEGGHSRHFVKTKLFMYEQAEAWHKLMTCLSQVTVRYLLRQVEAGADMLQLFDSWVGCLGREDYRQYVLPYSRTIIQTVRTAGIPVVLFGTGTASLLDLMLEAGPDVVGIDWRVDLADAWKLLGADTVLQGNLDPVVLLGPASGLADRVAKILEQAGGRPHIFNLGHGILPETPPENVDLVIRQVREWRRAHNAEIQSAR